jgi:hypothetical protein
VKILYQLETTEPERLALREVLATLLGGAQPVPARGRTAGARPSAPRVSRCDPREIREERGGIKHDSAGRVTAIACFHLLLALAWPAIVAAENLDCPFAGKRPPLDEILKLPLSQRPSLCKANLEQADLRRANLAGAHLVLANLAGARLFSVDLTGADLTVANLSRADLVGANLTGADLTGANLIQANLQGANLTKANLGQANLEGADLYGVNLTEAYMVMADLTGANLTQANLANAHLASAILASVKFEPELLSLDSVRGIEAARFLDWLRFEWSPTALIVLRERFAKAGLRDQERQVNFAKLRSQQVNEWRHGPFWRRVGAAFSYIAFDLTCAYGLAYGRPLHLLGGMILLLALVYTIALRGRGHGALWRVWQPDRIRKDQGQADPERLSWEPVPSPDGPPRGPVFRVLRALGLGLLFSLLSAFQIGWRELNVGNWITRLMPREYTLRATGWVRVVSGTQSLLSVYLLALWALTYFGRPFE